MWAGLGAGLAAGATLSALLLPFRTDLNPAAPALVLVLPVLGAAVLGGRRAALITAAAATVSTNVVFTHPYWSLKIEVAADAVTLAVFCAVATAVGTIVASLAERTAAAERRSGEVEVANAELFDVIQERAKLALEAQRVAVLEQVDEQRKALLRSVSHDLRTPLATIRGVATDLRSPEAEAYSAETRAELLELVADESERLDRLVANLLSMSRIEAGSFAPDLRAVDLDDLVAERVRRLNGLFRQVRIEVDLGTIDPVVDGDWSQLQQVVTNLLENAARHSPPHSTVRVTLSHEATPGRRGAPSIDGAGDVVLRVADEGPGIAEFEKERLFEAFRTGEGSRSSGIGLAICRSIIEAHGGSIAVGRTPGGGATFTVRLSARDAARR